ncbi:MAG: y4mF family transcriptional regulator [Planctomycetota bacterium]|jgi:y4mF family transcriptional regulator
MNKDREQIRRVQTPKELGQALREYRKSRRLTQDTAASLSNVSTNFLSDFENGKPTSEIGKVLSTLNTLGIELYLAPRGVIDAKIKDGK